jgi:hypothetical protein
LIYLQKGEKTNDHICELSAAADMFVFQKTTALCYVDTEQILDGALLFLGTKSKQSFFFSYRSFFEHHSLSLL